MDFGAQTPFTGTSVERLALDGLTNHRGRFFFETDTEQLYVCDGFTWYSIVSGISSQTVIEQLPDGTGDYEEILEYEATGVGAYELVIETE